MAIPQEILADYTLPRKMDITIRRGGSFRLDLIVETIDGATLDLDAATGSAMVRTAFDGDEVLWFSVAITAAAGLISVTATAAETAALAWPSSARACDESAPIGVYDVQIMQGGEVKTIVAGKAYLSRDVVQ